MHRLSLLVLLLLATQVVAQSPHGSNFKIDCADCHDAVSWNLLKQEKSFDHNKTNFPLIGQHELIDCKKCHTTLVFNEVKQQCFDCHKDIHKNSVSLDCEKCHTPNSWLISDIEQLHRVSRFPLLGVHQSQNCNQCHAQYSELNFESLGINCFDCHSKDYVATQNPNHAEAGFSTECQECHSISSLRWAEVQVTHTFFPLTGKHKISNCFECHQTNTFVGLSPTCYSCHQTDYELTANPNHSHLQFSTNCNECHTIDGWQPATFDHAITGFTLLGKHSSTHCASCHSSGYSNTPEDCNSCHSDDYNSTINPSHIAANFPNTCIDCHSPVGWSPATFDHDGRFFPINSGEHKGKWDNCNQCHTNQNNFSDFSCTTCHEHNQIEMDNEHRGVSGYSYISTACFNCHPRGDKEGAFNHNLTQFPLVGSHASVSCENCHQSGYSNTSTECVSCHNTNFTNTTNPNHIQVGISNQCSDCHNSNSWTPSLFSHSNTAFVLTGQHTTTSCQSCHQGQTTGTSQLCFSCHSTDYNSTTNPNHTTAGYPNTCEQCHSTTAWSPANFDHSLTSFPLTGQHTSVQCSQCHTSGYTNTPTDCYSCHQTNFTNSVNPSHTSVGLSTDCQSCHNTQGWTPSLFSHSNTAFVLTGQHINTSCQSCHQGQTTGTSQLCYSCHVTDFNSTTNPNHTTAGYPNTCEQCHSTTAWAPANFDHSLTSFPLTGQHTSVQCSQCHASGYTNTPTDCYSCHDNDYNSTNDPNHIAAQFPVTCVDCHSTNGWSPATFDHDSRFFPIYSGEHNGKWNNCSDCHTNQNNYSDFSCITCHEHNQTEMNDKHQGINGYSYSSSACYSCHPLGKTDGAFNHNVTQFPLVGSHTSVNCEDCHHSGYSNISTECGSCHINAFNNSVNPSHTSVGISTDCQSCHNTQGWTPSLFSHSNTAFVLTGQHINTTCQSCHQGQTTGTSQLCYSCHSNDFNSTTNPNHTTAGYPNTCEQCHSTTAWSPANFDHSLTSFPLTGQHTSVQCSQCHASGYSNTPTDCYSCHNNDYNNTNNPNHIAAQFPNTCADCHSTNGWTPATFDHDARFFPIYSGEHNGKWDNCNQCHTNQNNFSDFSCITCHEHNQTEMNDKHQGINGYSYISSACYTCHPLGKTEGAFNHNLTQFPLVGSHASVSCENCHQSGYSNISTECYSCHKNSFDNTITPNHTAIGISTACESCHSMNAWSPSLFSHFNTAFVLTGQHITTSCQSCHQGQTTGTSQLCYTCHQTNFANSVNPSHTAVGISTDCQSCHNTQGWTPSLFSHSNTAFVLTGQHTTTSCQSCHQGQTTGTSQLCFSCHSTDFNGTTNPNHTTAGYPNTCEQCHSTTAWSPANFDHSLTSFPLTGQHTSVQCSQCHASGYSNTPTDCYSCHQTNFTSSVNPNHSTVGISTDCQTCHDTQGWAPSLFDHSNTAFVLTGQHTTTSCQSCHQGQTTGTSQLCYSCHSNDFNSTTNPNHTTAGYPNTCEQCHSTTAWSPANFDHSLTSFPLTGQHTSVQCSQCHTSGYTNTPTDCYSCHQTNFANSVNPSHTAVGISTDCQSCHNTQGWTPSLFSHSNTAFVLTGQHITTSCNSCHQGQTTGTSQLCYSCHSTDYNSTTNPNHTTSNFPTTCQDCHTTSGWTPSTFDHDGSYFPIYTGKHRGKWDLCSDCHTNQSNYSVFSCINCHEHSNQTEVNKDHDEVPNYVYQSTACYNCHPRGDS
ncbi:MAG: hypothetical protein AB1521_06960 [Bacteroidota bacterium]